MAGQQTTRELWAADGPFQPYEVQRSRVRNVPEEYRKQATWGTVEGELGYHAKSNVAGEEDRYYPVEFNPDHVCWTEVRWIENLEHGGHWEAFRIAASDLGLDITENDVVHYTTIQRAAEHRHRTPDNDDTTPSRADTPSEASSHPEVIQVRPRSRGIEIDRIAQLAESLHIDNREMSQTVTAPVEVGRINPNTGHVYTEDDVALYRAIGPDQADPPRQGFPLQPGRGRFPGGGGPPGGGPPGGGPPGGGPPGGGFPGGPIPPILPQQAGHNGSDKLVGNVPIVFTGDRSKSETFMTQWRLYQRANDGTRVMDIPYNRAMFFLTYVQGSLVNEWVNAMSEWLYQQVHTQGIAKTNPWLWDSVELAFNRKFANVLAQIQAKASLKKGIKMERGDLDGYISKFEELVRQAGLDVNHDLVLDKFTDGLPTEMYAYIYNNYDPVPQTYEQWRTAAIDRQKKWTHMRGRLDAFKTTTVPRPSNAGWRGPFNPPKDPNAMDTSPGRTRARVTEAEDSKSGGTRWPQADRQRTQNRGTQREVICYRCQKPGHIARNCLQKPQQRQWQPRQGPSRTRQVEIEEPKQEVCDDRTAEQKAQDWLAGVANEPDEVKDLVMQHVFGKEDF